MEFKKKGTLSQPMHTVTLNFKCTVKNPLYTKNSKKYIDLTLSNSIKKQVHDIHCLSNKMMTKETVLNPLQDDILKVKIPFLHNRISCKVTGDKTVQELVTGDVITVSIDYCGVWIIGDYCGPSWKVSSLSS